jgi:endonuclease G, mitochondrial
MNSDESARYAESARPSTDYEHRQGYDPDFLGIAVPLPILTGGAKARAFKLPRADGDQAYELRYHHFSIIMNRETRLAFLAAVNFDASAPFRQARKGADRWYMDPRVDAACQAGDEFYTDNPLDRGHLVRRADAGWGASAQEAAEASDDTFHFTNCTPQHEIFNQATRAKNEGLLLWGNIEDHIARQAAASGGRLSIFNGPVFRPTDRLHRGLQIPKEFWKVVVYRHEDGHPVALAFLLSQEGLIENLPFEEFAVGPYQPYQIRVRDVQPRTDLDFSALGGADPLEQGAFESGGSPAIALQVLTDIVI